MQGDEGSKVIRDNDFFESLAAYKSESIEDQSEKQHDVRQPMTIELSDTKLGWKKTTRDLLRVDKPSLLTQ